MQINIFDDPEFLNKLNQDIERVEAIAKFENKSVSDVINEERRIIMEDIGKILREGSTDIKKSRWGEKYRKTSESDIIDTIAETFAIKWGFA